MPDYKYFEASPHDVRRRALWPMTFALVVTCVSFLIPPSQGLSLIGSIEGLDRLAVLLSDSAKIVGFSLITILLVAIVATRKRLSVEYRLKEAATVLGAVIVFAGGGALINEHFVKTQFNSPRPNVEWLEAHSTVEPEFSADAYYALEPDGRSRLMAKALNQVQTKVPAVIGDHWVTEPGYSFPSGHAYASFFLATFFLFFASSFVSSKRQSFFILLVPWAVAVSLSRVLLHVHRPVDISVGAVQGFVLGIIAWLLVRVIIRKIV